MTLFSHPSCCDRWTLNRAYLLQDRQSQLGRPKRDARRHIEPRERVRNRLLASRSSSPNLCAGAQGDGAELAGPPAPPAPSPQKLATSPSPAPAPLRVPANTAADSTRTLSASGGSSRSKPARYLLQSRLRLSRSMRQKMPQQRNPRGLALLRMKLRGDDVVATHGGGDDVVAVLGRGFHHPGFRCHSVK